MCPKSMCEGSPASGAQLSHLEDIFKTHSTLAVSLPECRGQGHAYIKGSGDLELRSLCLPSKSSAPHPGPLLVLDFYRQCFGQVWWHITLISPSPFRRHSEPVLARERNVILFQQQQHFYWGTHAEVHTHRSGISFQQCVVSFRFVGPEG